jgi:ABC-type transporter Mla MlaB component
VQHVVVRRPLDAAEATRIRRLLGGGTALLCDVGDLTDADLGTVDALARLHLEAGRAGCCLHLVGVPAGLRDLLRLAGLADLLAGQSR